MLIIDRIWPCSSWWLLATVVGLALFWFGCNSVSMDRRIADPVKRVQAYLDATVSRGQAPGIQYVVATQDGVVLSYAGGRADLVSKRPVSVDTPFLLSSTTKAFTAILAMELVDQGRLGLDESVSLYVTHPYGEQLTIRQLLNYSSGVPNPPPTSWFHRHEEHETFDEEAAFAEVLADHAEPDFTPGQKYQYSNIAFWLLGQVVVSVGGDSLEASLHRAVRTPLGLSEEDLTFSPPAPAEVAHGHAPARGMIAAVIRLISPGWLWGERVGRWRALNYAVMNGPAYGGLYGSAEAVARVLLDLQREEPRLLSQSSRDAMFSEERASDGSKLGATLGWAHGSLAGHQWIGKPGGGPGYFSNARVYPEQGLVSVLLVNRMEVREGHINQALDRLDREFLRD